VKKSVFHAANGQIQSTSPDGSGNPVSSLSSSEDDEDWYKFDDEKVSIFPKEKLATLDGGGRTHLLMCCFIGVSRWFDRCWLGLL